MSQYALNELDLRPGQVAGLTVIDEETGSVPVKDHWIVGAVVEDGELKIWVNSEVESIEDVT